MKTQILSNEEIASFCLELSLLLNAGISTTEALRLMAEEAPSAEHKQLLNDMKNQIYDGSTLPQALKESQRFPSYVCGLVEVGEETGHTDEALAALAQHYEGRMRLDKRIRSALMYPAIMLLLMLVVIAVLLIRVLPIFNDVYNSLGGRLTGVAGMLLSAGRGLDAIMPVIWALLAAAVVLVTAFAVSASFRQKLIQAWQKSNGDKGLANQINTAHLAQALAMAMSSGLPFEKALVLAKELVADIPSAQQRCQKCQELLSKGSNLSEAMQNSQMLPARQCRLLELSQRSSKADKTMNKIAEDMTEASEIALDNTISRVEPALVFVCSLLVGLILLSVMLPLMNIMSAIG